MEKDIQLGPEAKAVMAIADGKVSISIVYSGKQASANASISMDVEQYAALLKAAIPGTIDDTIIDLLVAAMKVI